MSFTGQGARIWDPLEDADIPAATGALADSIDPMLVGQYASTTARTTGTATARAAGKHPIAWVDGIGYQGWDGTAWVPMMPRRYFEQLNNVTATTGTSYPLDGWTSATGFTNMTGGIILTDAGVYTITLALQNLSAVVSNSDCYVSITKDTVAATAFVPVGQIRTSVSLTIACGSNTGIPLRFHHSNAGSITGLFLLTIAKVSP